MPYHLVTIQYKMFQRRKNQTIIACSLALNLIIIIYICISGIAHMLGLFPQQRCSDERLAGSKTKQFYDNENEAVTLSETEQNISKIISCMEHDNKAETLQVGAYWVLKNFLRAEHGRLRCFESVTYATHAEYHDLANLQLLLVRWRAPISIALFAPGEDMLPTLESIRYVRDCGPHSYLVRQYATFHLYFPREHLPHQLPRAVDLVASTFECDTHSPYDNMTTAKLYRTVRNLPYPANTGRNIARDAAMTHFMLVSDIEMIPSVEIPSQFLDMISRTQSATLDLNLTAVLPQVFPIVSFEVARNALVPANKSKLKEMLVAGQAVMLPTNMCNSCKAVPNIADWIKDGGKKQMDVFLTVKRTRDMSHWEPSFIGTHGDPLYDERSSWQRMNSKTTQSYAMCVLDYDFHILNNAFLVHQSNVGHIMPSDQSPNTVQLVSNAIGKELQFMYGPRIAC